jgi:hypothetical protein
MYIQEDVTSISLFYLETVLQVPSSGAQTTVSTASGISHTVTVICRYRGRVGTGLSTSPTAHSTQFQLFHDNGR